VKVIVSDFDNTLFKRYHGLILPVVQYLQEKNLPVIIVTYRAENQEQFIYDTLKETKLNIVGYGFADSRKKDPTTKAVIMSHLLRKYDVVEALDDDPQVVVHYTSAGVHCKQFA
jgi:hydroxymethylpyrimidine pyrophosphatase-like HAD family hydrolase